MLLMDKSDGERWWEGKKRLTKIKERSLWRTTAGVPQYPIPSHLYNPWLPSICPHTLHQGKKILSTYALPKKCWMKEKRWRQQFVENGCCVNCWPLLPGDGEALRLDSAKHGFSRINSSRRQPCHKWFVMFPPVCLSPTQSHHSHDSTIPDTELLDKT